LVLFLEDSFVEVRSVLHVLSILEIGFLNTRCQKPFLLLGLGETGEPLVELSVSRWVKDSGWVALKVIGTSSEYCRESSISLESSGVILDLSK